MGSSHKNKGFHSNTGSDHLKNHKATKQAFNVEPSSARKRNAISMAFRWRDDYGLLIVVFGSYLPSSTKKIRKRQSWIPSGKILMIDPG